MASISIKKRITKDDGDEYVETTIDIDDSTDIVITLDNGKQLSLATVTSPKRQGLFVNGHEEQQYSVKTSCQGGLLVIPD